jgi:hypothetical protein
MFTAPVVDASTRANQDARRPPRFHRLSDDVRILASVAPPGIKSDSESRPLLPANAAVRFRITLPARRIGGLMAGHKRGGPESAACGSPPCQAYRPYRRRGRVAEGGGLLNRYRVVKPYRGFESLRLRQSTFSGTYRIFRPEERCRSRRGRRWPQRFPPAQKSAQCVFGPFWLWPGPSAITTNAKTPRL